MVLSALLYDISTYTREKKQLHKYAANIFKRLHQTAIHKSEVVRLLAYHNVNNLNKMKKPCNILVSTSLHYPTVHVAEAKCGIILKNVLFCPISSSLKRKHDKSQF